MLKIWQPIGIWHLNKMLPSIKVVCSSWSLPLLSCLEKGISAKLFCFSNVAQFVREGTFLDQCLLFMQHNQFLLLYSTLNGTQKSPQNDPWMEGVTKREGMVPFLLQLVSQVLFWFTNLKQPFSKCLFILNSWTEMLQAQRKESPSALLSQDYVLRDSCSSNSLSLF